MEFLGLILIVAVVIIVLGRAGHVHKGITWDGYHESCSCGVSAGDKRDPKTGKRYTFFSEWPT